MKKKLLLLFVSTFLLFCFSLIVSADEVATGAWGANIIWSLDDSGTLTITGDGKMASKTQASNYPWFSYQSRIKKVVLSEGITNVPKQAFSKYGSYSSLAEVEFPDSLIEIEEDAFGYCQNLKKINLPPNIKVISSGAFSECRAEYIVVPKDIESFSDNSVTYTAVLYNGTQEEYEYAKKVNKLEFESIYHEFYFLDGAHKTDDGYLIMQENMVLKYVGYDKTVIIPDGVTSIGDKAFEAFSGNTYITEIKIPSSVVSIGNRAFLGCDKLNSITIPDSVTRIGYDCFYDTAFYNDNNNWDSEGVLWIDNFLIEYDSSKDEDYSGEFFIDADVIIQDLALSKCRELTYIYVDDGNELYSSDYEHGVLFNKDKSILIQYPVGNGNEGKYVIPNTVKTIASNAFYYNELTEIIIPEGVKRIEESAFATSYNLESLSLPESLEYIGEYAFKNSNISEMIIPDGVKDISPSLFGGWWENNSDITYIKLPTSISSIGEYAFANCYNLSEVVMPKFAETIGRSIFKNCSNLKKLDIPQGVKEVDLSDSYIETIALPITINNISFPNTIKEIFYGGCKARWEDCVLTNIDLTNVIIHYNENDPYFSCLDDCTVTQQDVDGEIGYVISKYNGTASTVYVPEYIKIRGKNEKIVGLGFQAFAENQYVKEVVLPDSIIQISSSCFENCRQLESINLDSVEIIDGQAFWGCNNLTDISFSENIREIGSMVFYETPLYDNTSNWYNGGFYVDNCLLDFKSKYEGAFSIKNGTRLIANNALGSRRTSCKITSINIPSSVEIIGECALWCSTLQTITVSENSLFFANDENGILYDKFFTTLVCCPATKKNIELNKNTKRISSGALAGCKIKFLKVSDSIELDHGSFSRSEIEKIILLEGRTSFKNVFQNLQNLKSIYIPAGVTKIERYSFNNCPLLSDVFYGGTEEQWDSIVIEESGNVPLLEATVHFGTKLSKTGNSFAVVDNGITGRVEFVIETVVDDSIIENVQRNFEDLEFTILEITLNSNEQEVEQVGDITVYLELPNGYTPSRSQVYRQETDGTYTDMNATYDDGYLKFSTEHLSVYVIAQASFTVGDLDGDDEVTDSDAIYLMYHTFFPEEYPVNQDCDFDGDGEATDNDAIYLMYHTFFPEEYPLSN